MEEYINDAGYIYTIDEINKAAKENNTTFEAIIKKNKLSLKKKKTAATEDVTTEVPGKPQTVVKKDAVATAKSTASKSEEPSSVSSNKPKKSIEPVSTKENIFGEVKEFDPFKINKYILPKKVTKDLRSKKERETGEVAPNLHSGVPTLAEYKRSKTSETDIPASVINNSLKNPKAIDFEIEKNDLDLKNPYLYYSNSKIGDDFVSKNYNEALLKKRGINVDDFDGFINRKKYKDDFIQKEQDGAFKRSWLEELEDYGPDALRMGRSAEEVKFTKEKLLNNYLNLYLKDKDKRAKQLKMLEAKKANPNYDWDEIKKNTKDTNDWQSKLDDEYKSVVFPTIKKIDEEKLNKEKQLYDEVSKRGKIKGGIENLGLAIKSVGTGFWDTTQDVINTGLDLIGFDKEAELGRAARDYQDYKDFDTRSHSYLQGKSIEKDGIKYLKDETGNIYDVTNGFNIGGLVDDAKYQKINAEIDAKGTEDWDISARGSAKATGQVLGAMIPQIILTEATLGLGNAALVRAAALKNGFTSVKQYRNILEASEAIGGPKALSKMPLGISKDMAGSIVAQSSFGYSNGYEQTLKAAKEAGINDKEAEALALNGGAKMALLYAATAPLSTQTKARELIFGSAEKNLIKEALEAYKTNGIKSFITNLTDNVKNAARTAVSFVEEGGKEAFQENIQQSLENEQINASINELAGQKILKEDYTYQDFVNTSGLAFLSGGMIANAKLPNFKQDPKQQIVNLVTLGQNPNLLSDNLDVMVANGTATPEEANQLKFDAIATVRQLSKIPKDVDASTTLDLVRKLEEVSNLETSKKEIAAPFHAPIDAKIKEINNEITAIYDKRLDIELEKGITTDIEKAKIATKILGLDEEIDIPELNTANDVITYLSENTELDENTIEDIADSYGAFVPLKNGKEALIINKEAASMDQVVTTGQHEFLHKLIYKAVKENPELQKKIGTDLYNHIEDYIGTELFNNTNFKNRYNTYKTDFENTKLELENKVAKAQDYLSKGTISQERYDQAVSEADLAIIKAEGKYLEETLPLLSEALTQGDIKYNETFFTKIGDILRRIFQKYGLSKVKFDTGKDVFNFVRDYNKSFEKGQFTKAFKELAKEGVYKGSIAKVSPTIKTEIKSEVKRSQGLSQVEILKNQLKEIQDNESDYDPDDFDQQVANLQSKIKKAIEKEKTIPVVETKKEISEEDDVKEIIKSEKGKVSSDKVQQIYNEKGLNGADEIIKLFKPITNRIVDKRRDAPGFDRELLTDEIETGKGGILDLIQKYDPKQGTPLAAYINKYLPVRAIATSKRILDQQFKKDVTEEKGLMAEETVIETKEKPKYKNVLESKVFEPETLQAINDKILTVVRTLKSKINEPISLNRTVTPIIAEIRDEIGKLVDIDVKTAMGGKKDDQLKNWLLKNKRYVLENMTTTWLMGKDGQGGMPIAVQKQINGKWTNYPEWVGQKIDREKTSTDNAGRTSGAELVRRLPNVANNISDTDYLAQVLGPDGNPLRGRKESLAKAIAEEASFDIINYDLAKEGLIYDALETNQKRLGVEQLNNIAIEISKQIERGNVKFSSKLIKGFEISKEKLGKDILNAKTIEQEVNVINNWIASDGRSLRTLAWEVGKGLKQFTTNRGLFENVILPIIKTYSKFEGIIGTDSYRIGPAQKGESIYFGETKVPLWADTTIIKRDWKSLVNTINTEAIKATNDLINIVKYFKTNNYTSEDFESYIALLRWDQRSLVRKVSKAGLAVLDMKKYQKAHLEHNVPVQNIVDKTIEFYNGEITEKELRDFIGEAQINLVPYEINKYLPAYKEGKNRMHAPEVVLYLQKLMDDGQTILNLESEYGSKENFDALVKLAKSGVNSKESLQTIYNNDAVTKSLVSFSKPAKGISVFDFDDTIGLTKSKVLYTMPDGSTGKLDGAEFAKEGARLLDEGAAFNFSEFSKVIEGKPGPMVDKMKKMIGKFGPNNFFILTARPANSAEPIHQFLQSIGIDIPLENIIGLGNSTSQAKADWMTAKAAEGYNDFYFADDQLPNVKAVKGALDVLDVKSKIQQARIKFSKNISPEFNKIIEENTGMESYKVFSDIVARRRGAGKNKFDFYVPPSAADFELLLYNFIGKGTRGEEQQEFFANALLKPYANGTDLMDAARQSIKRDYKALLKQFPDIKKELEKLTPDEDFTYDQAIRVAMWTEEDVEIPGISQRDQRKLTDLVNNDPELNAFKEALIVTGRQGKGWVKPTEYWDASTIISDLHNLTEGDGRKKFLGEFIENVEEMFGKFENGKLVGPNINKIEAVYGTNVREALEDQLYRMINGKNKSYGQDKETSRWSDWVNGSTGAIMFLNTRSAALQLLGAVNFLNLRDNNPFAAAKAFANQKQYWEDFSRIWNSDKMKERRGGLKEDVAAAEIANAAAGAKNKVNAVISYLLKVGYTPTQLADSFAIASGGAPFYRNRIKTYLKEGLTQEEAETAAWSDFTKISDETQQSGDPRDISKQQASPAGRLLLTFQNFSMQQARIVKKSFLDLKNGRGDAKTHVAKIAYYLTVQNVLFTVLQQGLFATLFDEDDEDEDKDKKAVAKRKTNTEKAIGVADDVLDTILRGTGFLGGIVSVLKNMYLKYRDEEEKDFKADYTKVVLEGANISPPIGSKLRKLYSGFQQTKFEKDLIKERGWGIMQDGRVHLGPMYGVTGKLVESTTNVPMDRLVNKIENISQALNSQNQAWQRIAVGVGFTPYSVGIEESEGDKEIRAKAKKIRAEEGKIKAKETRERTKDSIKALPIKERVRLRREAALKRKEERLKKRRRKMG